MVMAKQKSIEAEREHAVDLTGMYQDPTLLMKQLEQTEFLVAWVLLHAPNALNTRAILRGIVLAVSRMLIYAGTTPRLRGQPYPVANSRGQKYLAISSEGMDKGEAAQLEKDLTRLVSVVHYPAPETEAAFVNSLLKRFGYATLPTYLKVRNSLNNLVSLGIVRERKVFGKKEKALYYIDAQLFDVFKKEQEKRLLKKKKGELMPMQDFLIYFGDVATLHLVLK